MLSRSLGTGLKHRETKEKDLNGTHCQICDYDKIIRTSL